MIDDLPREDVLAAVDGAVESLLASAGVHEPPVDAIVLAQRHLGVVVCLDRNQPQRGRAQRAAGQAADLSQARADRGTTSVDRRSRDRRAPENRDARTRRHCAGSNAGHGGRVAR